MSNLLGAVIVTMFLAPGRPPDSCLVPLGQLQGKANAIEWYFFQGTRELTVFVVPQTSLPAGEREVTLAWSYPYTEPSMIWFRVDVLCAGSTNLIELILTHEAVHLAHPSYTHDEVDALVRTYHPTRFEAYQAELKTIGGRAAAWRYQNRHWLARATSYPGPPQ